jgi:hypothetical protein
MLLGKLDAESDAVLTVNLCTSVASTIRSAAFFCTELTPSSLRPSTVRENFERRLHRTASNPDLGWSEEDIQLIKRYFAAS